MTVNACDIPNLAEWCEEHDGRVFNIGQGLRWGVALSAICWAALAVGVAQC